MKAKNLTKKWTKSSDDAWDKVNRIKEGSKKDKQLDKTRGINDDSKPAKSMKKMNFQKKINKKGGK